MNIYQAKQIAARVTHLAELSATFDATYGMNYRLTDATPAEAAELLKRAMYEQTEIAYLLDPEALETPTIRYGAWWEQSDMMNTAVVNQLAADVFSLIGRCAYLNVQSDPPHTELVLQQAIAGMLHPVARQAKPVE